MDIDALKEALTLRTLSVAKTTKGVPVLSRNPNNPELIYINLQDWVELLESQDKTVDIPTMKILKNKSKGKKEDKPAPKDAPKTELKTGDDAAQDAEEKAASDYPDPPAEEVKDGTWTEAALKKIGEKKNGYRTLQKIAKKTPGIAADGKKEVLIKYLTGKAKVKT